MEFVVALLSRAREGSLASWMLLLVFTLLFLVALRCLADPGESWNAWILLTPVVCPFSIMLAWAGKASGWEPMVLSYLLGMFATWITAGPWIGMVAWRRTILALITPLLFAVSFGIGILVERWLPVLILK